MDAFKKFVAKLAAWSIVLVAVATALWIWFCLAYVYSSGERAGYVQKFSSKGWVVKTWEGDLAMVNIPGAMTEHFLFTVRKKDVAERISQTIGQRVVLKYEQHRFLPGQILGETEYFVVDVRPEQAAAVQGQTPTPASQAQPAAGNQAQPAAAPVPSTAGK
jgi:hypothetical protein